MNDTPAIPVEEAPPSSTPAADHTNGQPKTLDEILIAMDIVDTLRHREQLVLQELNEEAREEELIARLKDIYAAQGIDVDETTLMDGVKALKENRFAYTPPEPNFQTRLANIYVNRDRWLKPLAAGLIALVIGSGIWHFGVSGPQKAKEKAAFVELNKTLPSQLEKARDAAQSSTEDPDIKAVAETYYQDGIFAAQQGDRSAAKTSVAKLETLKSDISKSYSVRIVSRPNEYSGLFRVNDSAPEIRNYYLIVEAIDAAGRAITVPVDSEEDQSTKRVQIWGVRVPKAVFDDVSADKKDDQIIQRAIIGKKPTGSIYPTYSVDTLGGTIFEW
jgi:hypothetical protein